MWRGVLVAVFAVAVVLQGALVSSRARAAGTAIYGLREGLDLLAVERDLSIATHTALAAIVMDMYQGGHGDEVDRRLAALRRATGAASARLAERSPSDGWRLIHEEMTLATERLLASFDESRSRLELLAWLDQFLYDIKRVVPTDNTGRWAALLEASTWAQESPLAFRDYLELAMAREWAVDGRAPADAALSDEYASWLNSARRLRESRGREAERFSLFEEYILRGRAEEADSVTAAIVERLSGHPGVRQVERDTPYLLGLEDAHDFESVEEIYRDRDVWVTEVAAVAEELLAHARGVLDGELKEARRRDWLGRSSAGVALFFAFGLAAVTLRRRARLDAQLKRALQEDVLTGLANRYALFHTAPEILQDPERAGFALIHLDLDDFKSINDEHGHHIGDRALVEFASALQTVVRSPSDIVCRLGGDEFVILLDGLADPARQVDGIVERLRQCLEQPIRLGDVPTRIHFTAGVAVSDQPVSLEDLLVEADLALIEAKEKGRDVAQLFRRKLGRRMVQELSTALGSGEVRCLFQPQYDLTTGALIGLEALARWQREDRMQVPANKLIDAIEWLGAGRDWLRLAMRDIAAAWGATHRRLDGRIWLNLMRSDVEGIRSGELIDILGDTGVPLERIGVEVTDTVGRSELPIVAALLKDLREAGVRVALDDVGNDRVPLLHLAELPVDLVKLDRCIVRSIDTRPPLREVARSLAEMCARLGLDVLAEGIESDAEERVIRELGIRYAQGFLYSKPLPVSALSGFLGASSGRATGGAA